jgi:L-alanine-DL-glutamate epimerase-like enolase superfamily enzyme
MRLASVAARSLAIPFNVAFRHASAERSVTQTLWVEARAHGGATGFGEGCPREYVTSESLESALAFVRQHADAWREAFGDLAAVKVWMDSHRDSIDRNPSAWGAVEMALLDLLGRLEGRPVEALLGLPELTGRFQYTAVLGDAAPKAFEAQLAHYLKAGFGAFKIKLAGDGERDLAKTRALAAAGVAPRAVRADANNLWQDADAAIAALAALDFPFFALEEPLRAGDIEGMARVAAERDTRIILDESLLSAAQLDRLDATADRWIVNLRVSKMGGVLRSLDLVREARRRGLSVIVGAHVGETSLLTRAALTVASAARDILVGQEGAFGTHLLARDVVASPVMFGAGGVLDAAKLKLRGGGFGMQFAPEESDFSPASTGFVS